MDAENNRDVAFLKQVIDVSIIYKKEFLSLPPSTQVLTAIAYLSEPEWVSTITLECFKKQPATVTNGRVREAKNDHHMTVVESVVGALLYFVTLISVSKAAEVKIDTSGKKSCGCTIDGMMTHKC